MREIRGDWRDLFLTFRMALDLRKLPLPRRHGPQRGRHRPDPGRGPLLLAEGRTSPASSTRSAPGAWTGPVPSSGASESLFQRSAPPCTPAGRPAPRTRPDQVRASCPLELPPRLPHGPLPAPSPLPPDPRRHGRPGLGPPLVVAVWSFFGGAVTRIAAVSWPGRAHRVLEATRFARARYGSYLWSPLSVLAAAGLLRGLHPGRWLALQGHLGLRPREAPDGPRSSGPCSAGSSSCFWPSGGSSARGSSSRP